MHCHWRRGSRLKSDDVPSLWHRSHKADPGIAVLDQSLEAELLIVGAGFTGCSAALEAAQSGATVVVLEANTIGHGGSGRNVGLVNAGLWLPPDDITQKLGHEKGHRLIDALSAAPELVFQLIDQNDIDCEATRNGTLHLAHAPAGLKDLQNRYQQGNRIGAPLRLLDSDETAHRTGSRAFYGGLFDPRAGTIQPLAYCRGLARAARSWGAQIFEHSGVTKIRHHAKRWIASVNGHHVCAKHLLVATNAYAGNITGLPSPEFVPVYFSQYATVPLSDEHRRHILPGGEGCWDTDMVMSSVRVDQEGHLIIGGVGNAHGKLASIHRAWATRKLAQIYPELSGMSFEHVWSGALAMTANHLPKILSIGPNGLSVFGYSGRGIGPGTVFGQQVVKALLSKETRLLPVEICHRYHEAFKGPKTAYFEFGAAASHATRPRRYRAGDVF